jgi:hypothetical protein
VAAAIGIMAVAASVASWAGVPPALGAGAALVLLTLIWLSEQAWRRERHAYRDRSPFPRQWVITDDEIRVGGAGSTRAWRWPAVVAVDEHRDVYLLRQDSGIVLDIPRHALTGGQDGELRAFLMERGLLPPTGQPDRAT